MPHLTSIADALGLATVVLVIALCIAGLFCICYVLYFRWQIRHRQLLALQEFNAIWVVRILLILLAMLWGLTELLRLPVLRRNGRIFSTLGFDQQVSLCRAHTVLSLGFMEPCFFLTALFLIQGSIRDAPFTPLRKWNQKVIGLILICCLPVLALQALLVILCSMATPEGRVFGLPLYFSRSHILGLDMQDEVVCTYPLLNTLALGLFSCIYNCCFLWQGYRMVALVINKRLLIRVCGLVLSMVILLPVQVFFMGLSVLSSPGNSQFEVMAFLSFLTILSCVIVGEGILVVQPIADALAVRWVFKLLPAHQVVTHDPYSVPLFVFGNDEEQNTSHAIKDAGCSEDHQKQESFAGYRRSMSEPTYEYFDAD